MLARIYNPCLAGYKNIWHGSQIRASVEFVVVKDVLAEYV